MGKSRRLTARRLREILDYDPVTGAFWWKKKTARNVVVGSKAGHLSRSGYVTIRIESVLYSAHRLAWLHHYGRWPRGEIDHKDLVRDHNWIENLRDATQSLNNANRLTYKNNRSGFKGVMRHQGRWRAMIRFDGSSHHIGSYDSPEEANSAYTAKAREVFGEFANRGADCSGSTLSRAPR